MVSESHRTILPCLFHGLTAVQKMALQTRIPHRAFMSVAVWGGEMLTSASFPKLHRAWSKSVKPCGLSLPLPTAPTELGPKGEWRMQGLASHSHL